jgi:hypothetical protein
MNADNLHPGRPSSLNSARPPKLQNTFSCRGGLAAQGTPVLQAYFDWAATVRLQVFVYKMRLKPFPELFSLSFCKVSGKRME